MAQTKTITVFSPAKINLFLAITGRRADGFHDLVSVVAPLAFGDTLTAEAGAGFSIACDDPEVPRDGGNLILKAAGLFAAATRWTGGAAFRLEKRIPMGAGLGGGSSNATSALLALNELSGAPLGRAELAGLAAQAGSDCALFLEGAPVVMRGRGERVTRLPEPAARRLRGRPVLLFKPGFGVSTAWAYGRMAAGTPASYLPDAEAERRIEAWISGDAPTEAILFNNMEPAVFRKYLALPALRARLRERFGIAAHMTGSGSTCFALLPESAPTAEIVGEIRKAWGPAAFVCATAIA